MGTLGNTILCIIGFTLGSIFLFYIKKDIGGGIAASDLIGILSILITILIGWNIYNSLDVNRKVDNMKERVDNIVRNSESAFQDIQQQTKAIFEEHEERIDSSEEYMMGCVDFIQAGIEKSNYFRGYRLYVSAILHFCRCNNQVTNHISITLDNMDKLLTFIEHEKDLNTDYLSLDEHFNDAVSEIRKTNSDEFLQEQRDQFYELEKRRKRIIEDL